jgi:hypothetical protein
MLVLLSRLVLHPGAISMSSDSPESDTVAKEIKDAKTRFDAFFSAVGYAITQWAYIDSALFDFCNFSLATGKEKAAVVFYRSPNISDHLALVDKLMGLSLASGPTQKRWKKIAELIRDLLPFRNELAHNPPVQTISATVFLGASPDVQPPPRHGWLITTESTKLLAKQKKPIRAEINQVIDHIQAVEALRKEINALKVILPKRPKKLPTKRRAPKTLQAKGSTRQIPHKSQAP